MVHPETDEASHGESIASHTDGFSIEMRRGLKVAEVRCLVTGRLSERRNTPESRIVRENNEKLRGGYR
jgi:hypothetical protein